jgi:hypothetical protein
MTEDYINCVIVTKNGYFDQCKITKEDFPKYEKYLIGETVNGYKKLKFPDNISYIRENDVLIKVGIPNPELVKKLRKKVDEKNAKMMSETEQEKIEKIKQLFKDKNE